ncbi:RNA polymerase sigma factor [Echinicola vietnamensis]|uniref:RNA polymerase sigma-70 factor, expansion family 1 n=1 Tax=Echinicola vietnamensis (strain DSM 17526 / LMG 23754 / KMM 6221) TaxID=926556 RepID=L0FZK0_ECHVK|nr:RNA polymerase sigma-70 factor [Echinicola vietnamensis]AGA78181.1 RNA polymerase sigma-70 factor, expansion family 1 [Echinicola vietnamensis DSM 17526]
MNDSENTISDHQLLSRLKQGDNAAFHVIFDRYWKRLYAYAYNVYRDEGVCEDCVQEIFISLWQNNKTTNILHLESYLFKSIKYKLSGHIKKLKFDLVHDEALKQLSSPESESTTIEYQELEETLTSQINKLTGKCHEVFVLSRLQNKTNSEIAEELNISKRTVESHISNALKLLRTNLREITYFILFVTLKLQ